MYPQFTDAHSPKDDVSLFFPGTGASVITTLLYGLMLTVIGQTLDWYRAVDSVTGRVGYVMKSYVSRG